MTPGRNATGTNTAISTAVVAMIGPVTSAIAALAACSGRKPALELALDVLDDDDRIVDDEPDRQHHAEHADGVEREPGCQHTPSVAISETGMAIAGNDRCAPALQEQKYHRDDQQQRLGQA